MSFVNPALLFGALLFAVPLIIHLLNRQRFKRRDWAAMDFLMRAYKKQRRRIRTENLLLLLLRCLIPIIIALALARPVMQSGIAGTTIGGSTHHVLVLDHTYSMGYEPAGAQGPFARMRNLAGRLVEGLEGQRGTKLTTVLAGVRTEIPVSEELNTARVKALLTNLPGPQDGGGDLSDALAQVLDVLETSSATDTIVYLFTDMQVQAFGELGDTAAAEDEIVVDVPDETLFEDTTRDLIQQIQKDAQLVVIDVAGIADDMTPARADNLQIADLRLADPIAVVRNPISTIVTVRNRSDVGQETEVTLEVDDAEPQRQTVVVDAGAETEVEFSVTPRARGLRRLRASLDQDGLSADNERFLIVPVRDRIKVLMVEGSEETDPGLMDVEYIRSLLDPTGGEGPPSLTIFAPTIVNPIDFLSGRVDPREFDLIILGNVERLNELVAKGISDAMLNGSGLWALFGDRVDAASYNLHLHDSGNGPMPLTLTAPVGYQPEGDQHFESSLERQDHAVFAGFDQDVYREAFQLTPIFRYHASNIEDPERADVLATVRDQVSSPLLVASTHGAGKALFSLSPLSLRPPRWNRLDVLMLALPLTHESARWLSLPLRNPYNARVGGELTAELRHRPSDVSVLLPERAGGGKSLVGEISPSLPGNRFGLPPFLGTEFAGIYTVEMEVTEGANRRPDRLHFAVNPPVDEGELTYLPHASARDLLGVERIWRELPTAGDNSIQSGSSDFGLPLLYLALAFIIGEASLARLVSRRRGT